MIYFVLLGVHGYGYGGNDQIEIIPVLKFWNNLELYSGDFFISNFADRPFTERTPLLLFLKYTLGGSAWALLFWHAVFSIILITGLLKIATKLSGNVNVAMIAVVVTLTLGYATSLGGNELYYNLLIGSLIAKSLGAWAIYYWLEHRLITPYILLGIAAYFQPLVSLQIMLVLGFCHLKDIDSFKKFIPAVLTFLIIAGPWILALILNRSSGILSSTEYLEIIEFRLAHHFLPQYFELKDYAIILALIAISYAYYRNRFNAIVSFIWITVIVALCYSVSILFFKSTVLINTQWFKATIWIEFFGVIAALSILKNMMNLDVRSNTAKGVITVFLVAVIMRSWIIGIPPTYDLPFQNHNSHEIQLAEWVKDYTAIDDVFHIPLSFTYFKSTSERSSFIDFKAMIHDENYMKEVYGKVQRFYGLNLDSRRNGDMGNSISTAPLSDETTLKLLIEKGVDYIILPNSQQPPGLRSTATFGKENGWSIFEL